MIPSVGEGINWSIDNRDTHFQTPLIMGILNVTPDSFSDGGKYANLENALTHARLMLRDGADIIDVGGESTRPGSASVGVKEELARVIPVIKALTAEKVSLISIDTQKSEVALAAMKHGAHIVNDISAGQHDKSMMKVVADSGAIYIMMHMLGTPDIMQNAPSYKSVLGDIKKFFSDRIELAKKAGIKTSNIVLDPGVGFGKYLEHNLQIIANVDKFHELGCPLMLGTSRKSFMGLLDGSEVNQRMGGSLASVIAAYQKNVQIFRVHDVAETKQALNIFTAIQKHLV